MAVIDQYDRHTRLIPAVTVLLPLALGSLPWLNGEELGWPVAGRVGLTGLVTIAVATLLMGLVRAAGLRKQPSLWERWGGSPSLIMLRHSYRDLSAVTRARYHSMLATALSLPRFPDEADERSDPRQADEAYKAGIDFLISRTRDAKTFPLLYKENANYGFHRNLWAIRPVGIAFGLLGAASCAARVWLDWQTAQRINTFAFTAGFACLVLLIVWSALITRDWVRGPAFAYARVLLACTETIESLPANRK